MAEANIDSRESVCVCVFASESDETDRWIEWNVNRRRRGRRAEQITKMENFSQDRPNERPIDW